MILYVAVTLLETHVCDEFRHCDFIITVLEKTYIMYCIYNDYELKSKKAENKK